MRYRSFPGRASLAAALTLIALSTGAASAGSSVRSGAQHACPPRDAIVFSNGDPNAPIILLTAEITLMSPDGSDVTLLTNDGYMDAMASLLKGGKGKIVFDSNRTALALGGLPTNTNSDLFLVNADGTSDSELYPTPVTRGSSATSSPDGKWIAFHRARSGGYGPRIPGRGEPGGPTRESDIFVANLDDLLGGEDSPRNVTEILGAQAEDDADWSPDGHQIAFTSRSSACPNVAACQAQAEIWVMNEACWSSEISGPCQHQRLTFNTLEERSPDWSPDGTKLLHMCRLVAGAPFEICVLHLDGTHERLTDNSVPDLTPTWSPDGTQIAFQRGADTDVQVWVMNYLPDENGSRNEQPLTMPPSISAFPNWGTIAVGCGDD